MLHKTARLVAGLALVPLAMLYLPPGQQTASAQTSGNEGKERPAKEKQAGSKMSDAQKITLAMSAGPAAIAKNATIMDMPESPDAKPRQLRAGTNGWVCYAMVKEPMCLDKEWQRFIEAWMSKSPPRIEGTGIAYMLAGDKGASNTDPHATAPTADNQWVVSPPHIMVLYQDPKMLDPYPTDPKNGGPWVMWKGTPYAHLMVPVSATQGAKMPPR